MPDFSEQLLSGERVIWTGAPDQGLRLRGADAVMIPFSLMWCGFAIFWETMALTMHTPWFFRLWGVPFALMGLFMAFGRFFADAWLRQRTSYAVTNERVLITRTGPFSSFTAIRRDQLPEMELTNAANGFGTIRFGRQTPVFGRRSGFNGWMPALDPVPQFIGIAQAQEVFNIMQRREAL
jgi:hypothetical protein